MWLLYPLVVLVVLAIVGATLGGGVYTIVLIPLAGIALVSAVVYGMWARALDGRPDAPATSARPLPHRRRRPSGRAPSSPEALVDARRRQQ